MTYAGPLTSRLLRERTADLFKQCIANGGDPEEVAFEYVICDGCTLTINRLRDGDPIGWTTSGSREGGWRDLCADCTHKEAKV